FTSNSGFGGLAFLITPYQKFLGGVILAISLLVLGTSGILESVAPGSKLGGYLGYTAGPLLEFFGFWVSLLIFGGIVVIGGLIFWYLLKQPVSKEAKEEKKPSFAKASEGKPSLIKKFFAPKFKIKEVEPAPRIEFPPPAGLPKAEKPKPFTQLPSREVVGGEYQPLPLDLLEAEKGTPSAGDTKNNIDFSFKVIKARREIAAAGNEFNPTNKADCVSPEAIYPKTLIS
ncbi:unnamed protein product, partial [marine sediment metagenome]